MKKQFVLNALKISLALSLASALLCACSGPASGASSGAPDAGSVSAPSGEAAQPTAAPEDTAQPASSSPADSAAEGATLETLLGEVQTDVQPGTAGSTLKAVRVAADLLQWGEGTAMTVDEIRQTTVDWMSAQGNDAQVAFAENLQWVDNACQTLLQPGAEDLLESAGCSNMGYPWGEKAADAAETIMQAAGLR